MSEVPAAKSVIDGRCHCGSVQIALTPPTDFCSHCHCASCRRTHAAAFVTWTSVPTERFALVRGGTLRWYHSSATIRWGFCSECGTSMLYEAVGEGHPEAPSVARMYVAVGCLTDPLDQRPTEHVSFEERVPWLEIADGLPRRRGKEEPFEQ